HCRSRFWRTKNGSPKCPTGSTARPAGLEGEFAVTLAASGLDNLGFLAVRVLAVVGGAVVGALATSFVLWSAGKYWFKRPVPWRRPGASASPYLAGRSSAAGRSTASRAARRLPS